MLQLHYSVMRINRIPFFMDRLYVQWVYFARIYNSLLTFLILHILAVIMKLEHSFLFLSGCRCRGGNLHFNIKTDFNVGTFMVSMFFNCIYKTARGNIMINNIAVIYRFPFLFHHLRIGKGEFIKRVGFSFYGVAYLFPPLQK